MSDAQERYLQNDPDRAGGLISDGQGEFVQEHPGGVFDPRAFRHGRSEPAPAQDDDAPPVGEPPMGNAPMTAPGGEIEKTT
ncbi:hypothetical protein [Actinoplanes sp. N902-109]|uniref:hypothetical protein n=1 Tax=Actinoplanes sp. (strain N902-109) TaxID=649831 RepID=UPI00032964FE|nr:hypothetical protein [Actinoplanes sp. N902-109]AGL19281.1 hypothetical protein L083_5771 [Actinoplanes sp. N902-109]